LAWRYSQGLIRRDEREPTEKSNAQANHVRTPSLPPHCRCSFPRQTIASPSSHRAGPSSQSHSTLALTGAVLCRWHSTRRRVAPQGADQTPTCPECASHGASSRRRRPVLSRRSVQAFGRVR
jgi:hypothetical protein